MSGTNLTIDQIRTIRDDLLVTVETAIDRVNSQIESTTIGSPWMKQLIKRSNDLANEHAAILRIMTDAVLALPEVMAAAAELNLLAARNNQVAARLPAATDALGVATEVLALGQSFTDLIATLQKPA